MSLGAANTYKHIYLMHKYGGYFISSRDQHSKIFLQWDMKNIFSLINWPNKYNKSIVNIIINNFWLIFLKMYKYATVLLSKRQTFILNLGIIITTVIWADVKANIAQCVLLP